MKALEHLVKELKFYLAGTSKVCVCKFVWVCVDDSLNVGAASEKIFSRQHLRMFEGEIKETQKESGAAMARLASWCWNDGCR